MTILDIVIIAIGLISLLVGFLRGFVREVLSIITWVAAIWLGQKYYALVGEYFKEIIKAELFRNVAGFAVIFFTILIIFSLVSYLVNKLVTKTGIKGTDRVLGSVFGIARAVLIVVAILLIGHSVNLQENEFWKNSILVGHFEPIVEIVNDLLPSGLKVDGFDTLPEQILSPENINDVQEQLKAVNEVITK